MDDGLYTNRNARSDFIENAILKYAGDVQNIYIAVAFFTEESVVRSLLDEGCRIRLVVRLGFPTDPKALEKLLRTEGVDIRYFTNRSFHPKLLIFGNKTALIGSANLTRSGVLTNQEIMLKISSAEQHETLSELASLFNEYWEDADVLNEEILKKYAKQFNRLRAISKNVYEYDDNVVNELGDIVSQNIGRGQKRKRKENLFLDEYRRIYQESNAAFNIVRSIYESMKYRKVPEQDIPLRLEIDSFISYVRDEFAKGEVWRDADRCEGQKQYDKIAGLIKEWQNTNWPYFEEVIVKINYPLICKVLGNPESIRSADDDTLFDGLKVIHSFFDRRRFYDGGLATLKKLFFDKNDKEKIRESLTYLLFGQGEAIVRMANMIYDSDFKLHKFGPSNVQELIGWINREELPVVNRRTLKVLRFMGFNINVHE